MTGALLDFPDAAACSTSTVPINLAFAVTDTAGTTPVAAMKNVMFEILWFRFDVLSTAPGTAYCDPGAAGVMACPCGNAPAGPGQGCSNSLGVGASISGSGTASVSASTVVISASGIGSSGAACAGSVTALTCILLQGNANASAGLAFNDGVRCFSGTLKRLETATSAAGVFTSAVDIPTVSAALGDTIGATTFDRYYGVWHRDPCGTWACASPLNSNVTNSYAILWTP